MHGVTIMFEGHSLIWITRLSNNITSTQSTVLSHFI